MSYPVKPVVVRLLPREYRNLLDLAERTGASLSDAVRSQMRLVSEAEAKQRLRQQAQTTDFLRVVRPPSDALADSKP